MGLGLNILSHIAKEVAVDATVTALNKASVRSQKNADKVGQ